MDTEQHETRQASRLRKEDGDLMPKVGKGKTAKKFPYTAKGRKAAASYAKRTGRKVSGYKKK